MQQTTPYTHKLIEEMLLHEVDNLIAESSVRTDKVIYELFKCAILKKHKDCFDVECLHGEVKIETLNKCIDYVFSAISAKIRLLPNVDDDIKNNEIERGKQSLASIKVQFAQMLNVMGIRIVCS